VVKDMTGDKKEKKHSLSEREAHMVEEGRKSKSIPQKEAKEMIGMD